MELRPGYKQTEIGVIPEDWEPAELGEIALLERGRFSARPRNDPKFFGGNIPFIQTGEVAGVANPSFAPQQFLNEKGLKQSRLFKPRTLFFTIAANIADVGIAPFATACPDSIIGIQEKQGVDKQWLFHELSFRKAEFEALATPGAQLNLNLERLRPYKLAIPQFLEQKAIAAALSDVDASIAAQTRVIAKKHDLRQGTMQRLLTGQTRLPGFTAPWLQKRLGELGSWRGGMTPSMQVAHYWEGGSFPWLTSGDVKSPMLNDSGMHITEAAIENNATTVVPAGSIIFVMRSGILRKYLPVASIERSMAINQDIKALTVVADYDPSFIRQVLHWRGDDILQSCLKTGTTVESIDFGWLKAIELRLPSTKQEQTAIAEALSDMDAEISALEIHLDKTRALKQAMMQALLTGRVRLPVRSDVVPPTKEAAHV